MLVDAGDTSGAHTRILTNPSDDFPVLVIEARTSPISTASPARADLYSDIWSESDVFDT
jgi:hypothetical protein